MDIFDAGAWFIHQADVSLRHTKPALAKALRRLASTFRLGRKTKQVAAASRLLVDALAQ
jgi:hypothetical protein